jgi:chromatin remodeling complex protein RSC6
VIAWVHAYNDEETRAAQESVQIYLCIMASLTEEAMQRMSLFIEQYTINEKPAGLALLKLIIQEAYIDTNATTKIIREKLSSLDKYMTTVGSDIEKFNLHVKGQLDALQARGQTTHDLLANLFKGYGAASDKTFRAYIKKKEEDYEEGIDIDTTRLMLLALNKYKTRLVEEQKWNAPSDEEAKIIALEAQLKKLASSKKGQADDKKKRDNRKGKPKGKQEAKRKKAPWMTVPPKEGDPRTKTEDGKVFHWCTTHKAWGFHKGSDCKGIGATRAEINKGKSEDQKKKVSFKNDGKTRAIKLSKALANIAEEDDDDGEAEE